MKLKLRDGEAPIADRRLHALYLAPGILAAAAWMTIGGALGGLLAAQKILGAWAPWAFGLAGLAVGGVSLGWRLLVRATTRYLLTTDRFVTETGIVERSSKSAPLGKINDASHKQTALGRILGYGDVQIETGGEQGALLVRFVSAPEAFKEQILDAAHGFARYGADWTRVQGEGTKQCPQCAETILAGANVCRYCRWSFAEERFL